MVVRELPSSGDLDPYPGTDAPTTPRTTWPPTTPSTGKSRFSSTLAIVAKENGPYADEESADGIFRYAYREGDTAKGDNRKLRAALDTQQPLILFHQELPNYLTPVLPVYVIGEDPVCSLSFKTRFSA